MKSSEGYCSALYKKKYNELVRPKLENALHLQVPTSIEEELATFSAEYHKLAIGPATDYMFQHLRAQTAEREAELSLIPGPVQDLRVVGADSDRIKFRWEPPLVNAGAVEEYVVKIKFKGKDWEEVGTFEEKKRAALVTGLECSTWYCLMVLAKGSKYTGNQVAYIKARTGMSQAAHKALRTTAIIASPIVAPYSVAVLVREDWKNTEGALEHSGLVIAGVASIFLVLIPGLGHYQTHKEYETTFKSHYVEDIKSDGGTQVLWWDSANSSDGDGKASAETADSQGLVASDYKLVDVPSDSEEWDSRYVITEGCEDLESDDENAT